MKESELWQKFKKSLSPGNDLHVTRIENTAGSGVSDVLVVYGGRYMMVELKVAHAHWIELRPAQLAWIAQHIAAGGNVRLVAIDGDQIYCGGWSLTWWQLFLSVLKQQNLRYKFEPASAGAWTLVSAWSDLKKILFG